MKLTVGDQGQRALPRFGSRDQLALNRDMKLSAFIHTGRALGQQIFIASIVARDRVAAIYAGADEPRGDNRTCAHDTAEFDPRLDDLAVFNQSGAGFTEAVLDQPFRQSGTPPTSAAPA